jgi:chemotaxis protein methyltransferase CheR
MNKKGEHSVLHRPDPMSLRDFRRLGDFIQQHFGIRMPDSKKTMLEARLQKRLRSLGLSGYSQYMEVLFSGKGNVEEIPHLLNVVTTNTTHFFREPRHFDFLSNTFLPRWCAENPRKTLRLWSAGCSTGEEPYTLAMVLSEYAVTSPGFHFRILATDIATRVLQMSMRAIYAEEKVQGVPKHILRKYFLRSKDRSKKLVRLAPEIRNLVEYSRLNFMEPFSLEHRQDVIFCRNVLIYFERSVQESIILKLCENLKPGGYLFIGHSESVTGMALPLRQVAPTVYTRN